MSVPDSNLSPSLSLPPSAARFRLHRIALATAACAILPFVFACGAFISGGELDTQSPATEDKTTAPTPEPPQSQQSTDPNIQDSNANPAVLICRQAISRMITHCGVQPSRISYSPRCDNYNTCEAQCFLAADCGAFDRDDPEFEAKAHAVNACKLSCYAQGPGTCAEADAHRVVQCHGEPNTQWQEDDFCDPVERCQANCTLATSCIALRGLLGEAKLYQDCLNYCAAADTLLPGSDLLAGPDIASAEQCENFPSDLRCKADHPKAAQAYCLSYPKDPSCEDIDAFCTENPTDKGCIARSVAQEEAPEDPSAPTYCAQVRRNDLPKNDAACQTQEELCTETPDNPWCNPLKPYCEEYPSDSLCLTGLLGLGSNSSGNEEYEDRVCKAYPFSPECAPWRAFCFQNPTSPACRDADPQDLDDEYDPEEYCEIYATSIECDPTRDYCVYYPDSPECDDTYEPWCVQHPSDPYCD